MADLSPGYAVAPASRAAAAETAGRGALRLLTAGLWTAVLTGLGVYLLIYVDFAAILVAYPFDFDQGEGYDVNSGWLLAQGGWIYNDNNVFPFYSSNYPPIFSLLLAALIPWFGVSLGLGRVVSIVAAILTVAAIVWIARRERAPWPAAAAAGLLYLASPYVFHTTPLARVNALAVLFGIVAVFAFGRLSRRGVAIGVVFSLLALYTKQTAIDAVGAGLLFVLWRRPRRGVVALAAIGGIGALIFWSLDRLSAGQFWVNIVAGNVNPFDWDQARAYLTDYLAVHLVLIGAAVISTFEAARRRSLTAFHFFFLFSLLMSLTAGKWGAGESYFLANIAAAGICLGWLAGATWSRGAGWAGRLVLPSLLLWQLVLFAHGPLDDVVAGWRDHSIQAGVLGRPPSPADREAAESLVASFDKNPGLVLAEENGFLLATNRPIVGNASHLRNLYLSGHWQPDGLIREIEARRFGTVVLSGYHYPEPVMEALGRNYDSAERYRINGFGYLVLVRKAD